MTAELRQGKILGLALVAAACALAFASLHAIAATSERVVVNRHSGVAIDGFDPVAYFTDGEALKGSAEIEANVAGIIWRFRNEANRAFFIAAPDIYGPQFGGYDPMHVARGVAYPGTPRHWMILDQRLYLFADDRSRAAFAARSQAVLEQAMKRWPRVESLLAN